MSAKGLFETAPLGSLIRYSNGEPQPPDRFTNKLRAWKRENGHGRLVRKSPSRMVGSYAAPDSFTLHDGDFRSGGIIMIVVKTTHSVQSHLAFEVAEAPPPGSVLCLTPFGEDLELQFLAPDRAAAAGWHAHQGRYSRAVFHEVQADGSHGEIALETLAA